ncbi:DUF1501 domain-containing protein [Lignipirellula cremea]|uniref:DUF1501 domain-containing protein n=1 Tax=Lignipirellula cremea TaxID=2528010 RepID=A0A518DKG2_9BACT|nr:DUF1501 domain-containing protein [Lignipirellula cremea]QDU92326.1 hypothetical protein Pla8534_00710 [Lignipirellula cremea]
MLTLTDSRFARSPSVFGRRDFLRVGSLCGLTLPGLLAAKAQAAPLKNAYRNKSVVFLFLQGGPPQIETFDPKLGVTDDIRSCTGEIPTNVPGVWFGGTFPKLAQRADRLAVVRSFASGQGGHNQIPILTGNHPSGAAMGAMCARGTGAFNMETGVPMHTVIIPEAVQPDLKLGQPTGTFGLPGIESRVAGAGNLGNVYKGFVRNGSPEQLGNFSLKLPADRFADRFQLLGQLDELRRRLDQTGELDGVSEIERQAHDLLLRGVGDAFDLSQEDPKTIARYDTSHLFNMADYHEGGKYFLYQGKKKLVDQLRWTNLLGKEMLLARRLCEAGCGFVTVVDSSWDFHGGGANNPGTPVGMKTLGAQVDHAVAAFLDDLDARGLSDDILLVITGEMGRTPKKSGADGGTNHHGSLTPLLLAGGGLKMGQAIGSSDRIGARPASKPYGPENLLATVLHTLFDAAEIRIKPDIVSTEVANTILNGQPIEELF